jgi:hypothetical protein
MHLGTAGVFVCVREGGVGGEKARTVVGGRWCVLLPQADINPASASNLLPKLEWSPFQPQLSETEISQGSTAAVQ